LIGQKIAAHEFNAVCCLLCRSQPSGEFAEHGIRLGRLAVELAPDDYEKHNTLGFALYRGKQYQEAIRELSLSVELARGKDLSYDAFFLSMCHHHLGNSRDAAEWYRKAVDWMDQNDPENWELRLFRAEAQETLGILAGADTTNGKTAE
jgi:tetratricopeptide (TPR) repeat protein